MPLTYTVCFSVANLFTRKPGIHTFEEADGLRLMTLRSRETDDPDDVKYGDLSFGTDAPDVDVTRYWYRGNWFDNLATYWKDFREYGRIQDRDYPTGDDAHVGYSSQEVSSMAATVAARPGETARVRFVLTWSTPNCVNYWNRAIPAARPARAATAPARTPARPGRTTTRPCGRTRRRA
jgi:hypothetical protein